MNNIDDGHLSSLSGEGLYSFICNSTTINPETGREVLQYSKPFHDAIEKTIKSIIGDFKNPEMDAVVGKWHRWKHGHDLLDIRGTDEIGHLLTDLFTKDGLPLPGMSQNYLGAGMVKFLESMGVKNPIAWLNMNGFDHFFGWISAFESANDLQEAISYSPEVTEFTWETFLDTFGEGTIELFFGIDSANPVLVGSAATEYASGLTMLYKKMDYENSPFYDKLLTNLPTQSQLVSAFEFYLIFSTLKNTIMLLKGNLDKSQFIKTTVKDVTISLGTFTITKTLITTTAIGSVTGGMLLPILIGAGSSFIVKKVFEFAFPNNKIILSEKELWGKSPFEYETPWNKSVFNNDNIWQKNIFTKETCFNNGSIWQKPVFDD